MRLRPCGIALIAVLPTLSAFAQDGAAIEKQLVGTWRLISYTQGSVLHHVEVDRGAANIGGTRKRFFTLSGNRLHLPMPPTSGITDATLIWERIDQ